MHVDDGFYQIQSQTGAGLIAAAAAVYLVESLKHVRQILSRNLRAGIANQEPAHRALLFGANGQLAAVIDEFHCIVHEIVNDTIDMISVTVNNQRIRHFHIHVQMLIIDLIFKTDQHARNHFNQVERRRCDDKLSRLNLRSIQHAYDQTRQSADFLRDNL